MATFWKLAILFSSQVCSIFKASCRVRLGFCCITPCIQLCSIFKRSCWLSPEVFTHWSTRVWLNCQQFWIIWLTRSALTADETVMLVEALGDWSARLFLMVAAFATPTMAMPSTTTSDVKNHFLCSINPLSFPFLDIFRPNLISRSSINTSET